MHRLQGLPELKHCGSRPAPSCRARRLTVVTKANFNNNYSCPYATLGLEVGAGPDEVKQAYRKLAKQHHPDVTKEHTSLQFLSISEAYSFLTSLAHRGGGDEPRPANSAAFHDWYWSFRMSRSWERQQRARGVTDAAAAPDAPQPQSQEGLRSQLAGLRHRAAIRRNRPQPATASTDAAHMADEFAHSSSDEEFAPAAAQEAFYVSADGPSDCADAHMSSSSWPPAAPQAQHSSTTPDQHLHHASATSHPQQELQAADHFMMARAAAGAAPPPPPPPRRKFVANSEVRSGLKQQLSGLRRKAHIKQQFQQQNTHAAA